MTFIGRNKIFWNGSDDKISGYSVDEIKSELADDNEFEMLKKINLEFDIVTFDSQTCMPFSHKILPEPQSGNEYYIQEYQKPYIYCLCNQEIYDRITNYYDKMYPLYDSKKPSNGLGVGLEEELFGYSPNTKKYYSVNEEWKLSSGDTIMLSECVIKDKNYKFIRSLITPTHCSPLDLQDSGDDSFPKDLCILMFLYNNSDYAGYFKHVYNNLNQISGIKSQEPMLAKKATFKLSPMLPVHQEKPIDIAVDVDVDGRLLKACKGLSFSQGGLNIAEFKSALLAKFGPSIKLSLALDKCTKRSDLNDICKSLIKHV